MNYFNLAWPLWKYFPLYKFGLDRYFLKLRDIHKVEATLIVIYGKLPDFVAEMVTETAASNNTGNSTNDVKFAELLHHLMLVINSDFLMII
jgi:hypothetical protein